MDRTGAQTMLYLSCSMISSVEPAHYRVSLAKDWVSVDCGTRLEYTCGKFWYFQKLYIRSQLNCCSMHC